jgi:ferric hydroxamate transport system substrate-binding protein
MTRTRPFLLVAALAALVTGAAACGTTEDGTATAGGGGDAITLTDSRGEEVVLADGPASRVVALEWMHAENLVTLGVQPVGVADVEGYTTWAGAAVPLGDDVADVGTRAEPSVDAIIDLDPDLILAEADSATDLLRQLEELAPVLVVAGSDAGGNLERMREAFSTVAEAVGREDEGEQVLDDLDAFLDDSAAALDDAGMAGEGFAMADGWMDGSTISIRMFGEGSLMSDLAEAIGLENAWTGEVDEVWGLGTTDLEGLTALGDAHLFYSASEEDVFESGMADNPVWENLPVVAAGNVHKLEPGTWTFGGPAASRFFVEQVVETLAS